MNTFLSAAGIALVVAVLGLSIKKTVPQMATVLTLAAGIFLLFFAFSGFVEVINRLGEMAAYGGLSRDNLVILIKVLGVSVVTRIVSETCLDSGERGLSAAISFAGAVEGLILTLPLVSQVLRIVESLIGRAP